MRTENLNLFFKYLTGFPTGFEEVMHESRKFPRPLPRPGKNVTVLLGSPINSSIEPLIAKYHKEIEARWRPSNYGKDVAQDLEDEPKGLATMRSHLAEVLRGKLMELGQKVGKVEQRGPDKIRW